MYGILCGISKGTFEIQHKLDMSTACRCLKSPQSQSNSSTHPTIWPWNYKVKVIGVVKGQDHTVSPVSNWFAFFYVSHQSDNNSPDTTILKFDLEKSKVMGEVKGQGDMVHPVSNRCTSFSFHINQTNHSWNMSNSVWPWKNRSEILAKKKVSNRIPPKSNQVIISLTRGI